MKINKKMFSTCVTVLFMLISRCYAYEYENFNKQEPITISCVFNPNQYSFFFAQSDETNEVHEFVENLNNGRDLSLCFMGYGERKPFRSGDNFKWARDWSIKTDTNVCFITYYSEKFESSSILSLKSKIDEMINANRLEFVAQVLRDLVVDAQMKCDAIKRTEPEKECLRDNSQLHISGFSLGAHIATYFCRIMPKNGINAADDDQIAKLNVYDPARAGAWFRKNENTRYTDGTEAKTVQVVHTSSVYGTSLRCNQCVNIEVIHKYNMFSFTNHMLALKIHKYTSKKAVILIATINGNGNIIKLKPGEDYETNAKVQKDECLIGIYSDFDKEKHGLTFKMKITENIFDEL